MKRSSLVLASTLILVVVSCSSSRTSAGTPDTTTPDTTTTVPSGAGFYAGPGALPEGPPGTMVWSTPIDAPAGAKAWKILYKSKSVADKDIVVSGVLVVPDGPAPTGGRRLVTWAHGTTGVADACAPSMATDAATELPAIDRFVKDGYVVVASDYEGLGTPGLHPYLVGESEGRGVLDAVRAARGFTEAHAGGDVAIYGYSQGGHAALFAGQMAATYAPELHIVGDVAGAPVGDLKALMPVATNIAKFRGFAVMGGFGFSAAYPEADLKVLLTPEAYELGRQQVEKVCVQGMLTAFEDPAMTVYTKNPLDVAPWPDLLTENTPGSAGIGFPVLALQGLADQLVPPAVTESWRKRACALGTPIELKTYPGLDHGPTAAASAPDAATWIEDRFAGTAFVDGCALSP